MYGGFVPRGVMMSRDLQGQLSERYLARCVRIPGAGCPMNAKKSIVIATLLLASLLIAAARVDLGIAVGSAPPPPPVVVALTPVVPAPGPGYVWVPAHWDWVDGKWVWIDGRWMLPPRPQAVWVAPTVDFRLHRGHWR
jgi:hypothetical protein